MNQNECCAAMTEIKKIYADQTPYCIHYTEALNTTIDFLKNSASQSMYDQCVRERDTAIDQLRNLGYSLGEELKLDDIVSRQAVLDIVEDESNVEAIKKLPSILPRKEAEWIQDGDVHRCSKCHAVLEGDDWKWRNNYYCYHCGAEMRLEWMK